MTSSTAWKEEIFGPVLCVAPFSSEEQAVALANASEYGLAAAVFSTDSRRCARVASALEAGVVWQNCSQVCFAHDCVLDFRWEACIASSSMQDLDLSRRLLQRFCSTQRPLADELAKSLVSAMKTDKRGLTSEFCCSCPNCRAFVDCVLHTCPVCSHVLFSDTCQSRPLCQQRTVTIGAGTEARDCCVNIHTHIPLHDTLTCRRPIKMQHIGTLVHWY